MIRDKEKTYTSQMEDAVFLRGDLDDYDGDYSQLLDEINSERFFRTFGEALLDVLQQQDPNITAETAVKYIEKRCIQSNVPRSDIAKSINTLKDWFRKEVRPRKGDNSRRSMFALAFALQLSPESTANLFHKVYLDRAFDYRNEQEIIYYYCLNNQKTWNDAQRLISYLADKDYHTDDHTVYTLQIKNAVKTMSDEMALIDYIISHGHNLEKKSLKARECLQELIQTASEIVEEETKLNARRQWAQKYGILRQEIDDDNSLLNRYENCSATSKNHIYEVIVDQSVHNNDKWNGTKTLFGNARLPDEIRKRFPEAITLSKKGPTYEEQRKLIILLASYIHWYKTMHPRKYFSGYTPGFDDYIEWINGYLAESGLSPMYYGNPYDWLFMFCAISENPLVRFRDILDEVLTTE